MPYNSFDGLDERYRGFINSNKWSLCLGAGICTGILPNWEDLTCRVLKKCVKSNLSLKKIKEIFKLTGWGLDAWLQSALNKFIINKKTLDDFIDVVEEELYSSIYKKASKFGLSNTLCNGLIKTKTLKPQDALKLYDFFFKYYKNTTMFCLANWLVCLAQKNKAPFSILNFNADGILDTLIKLILLHQRYNEKKQLSYPKDLFCRAIRASDRPKGIPIYHLHGCLVPQGKLQKKYYSSRDKLVFPESGYSRISSSVFTWQQTVFLSHAQSSRLIFIGLSMSDPNIRRWLSWCTTNSIKEVNFTKGHDYVRGEHLWITQKPENNEAKIIEHALIHLGIRICWIKTWDELLDVLNNLLPI